MTATLGDPARRLLEGEPFEPDRFQIDAIRAVERGASVVVTAPTGSGKTLIAEAALEIAVASGHRAFYTAPIKALSNQKYRDLVDRYGETGTGLLTGDNTINGEAPVVVMTTEVLRNMIYADSPALAGLGVVILDEVHYLQDRYRGSVWEEIIIHLDAAVQLVNLSATIANPEEFAGWVRSRRGETELIVERHRPVPLESMYLVRDRHHGNTVEWFPVFDRSGSRANGQVLKLLRKGRGRHRRFAIPSRQEVAESLLAAGKLPAIYFIFSRAGCEAAARTVATSGLRLTTREERTAIRAAALDAAVHLDPADLAVLGHDSWMAALEAGVAAHHAGMVPAFKETVEQLFSAGLIKLVFATETLALGINMPAKAVVLEAFSKFNGERHEMLRAGDYTQLTGRAGRRGIDDRGTAAVLYSPYVPFEKVADVAGMGSHPLVSSFEPSYNMAVNLIANYPRGQAEELLRASFAQFRAQERMRRLAERIAEKAREVEEFRAAAQCDRGDIEAYAATRRDEADPASLLGFVAQLEAGDVLDLGDGVRWVILARGYGKNPRFLLLSEGGEQRRRPAASFGALLRRAGTMDLPEPVRSGDAAYRKQCAAMLRAWSPTGEPVFPVGGVVGVDGVGACARVEDHLHWLARSQRAAKDLRRLERRRGRSGDDDIIDRFHARMTVLQRFGYVTGWQLSPKGRGLRRIYNETDLLLSEAIERGLMDGLDAPRFAAMVSLFTYEARVRDPDGGSPTGELADRYAALRDVWEEISQVEERRNVVPMREPDPGFAPYAYGWAAGADLEELYGEEPFSAGDFVRNCRQILDLTRQLRDGFPALGAPATATLDAVDRGIVAVGGRL